MVVVAAALVVLSLVGNVFTRQVLGFSIFGAPELARFAFLWVIWMGVSIAVKRGAVTVLTLLSHRGPAWWQRSVRTSPGWRSARCWSTLLAGDPLCDRRGGAGRRQPGSRDLRGSTRSPDGGGYYFITLHYAQGAVEGAARVVGTGRAGLVAAVQALAGAAVIGAAVWLAMWALLEAGRFAAVCARGPLRGADPGRHADRLHALHGRDRRDGAPRDPRPGVLPVREPQTPFSTTQFTMGLSGGLELLTILMFLIVAAVMNASGMSARLIAFAASLVAHVRGGMAYVCQVTSAVVSGISGSAQADAAIMTPLLVPAMEREGYRRDVAAAVVAGASIKGPIGPLSIMFIVYGVVVSGAAGASISKLLLSGLLAEILLFIFQAATVYVVVRKMDFLVARRFSGWATVGRRGLGALPVLAIPVIILGGIFSGVFTIPESAAIGAVASLVLALFWYGSMSPLQLPGAIVTAGMETGIVLLLLGDSAILAKAL